MYEETQSLIPFLQQEEFSTVDAFLDAALRRVVDAHSAVYRALVYHPQEDGTVSVWAMAELPDAPKPALAPVAFADERQAGTPRIDEENQYAFAPLRDEERLLGLLVLMFDDTSPMLAQVIDFAAQLTFGIQYLEMRATRQHLTAIMHTFNEWVVQSSQERDETAVLSQAVTILREASQAEEIAIFLLNPAEAEAVFVAEAAFPQALVGATVADPHREIVQALAEVDSSVLTDCTAQDSPLCQNLKEQLGEFQSSKASILPMYDAQNTLLGMVILAYSAGSVQEERLRMVQAIVVQLTMNLQKSRLLRESQNQAAQMQRLTTFSEAMQATLRTSELLSILLERLPYLLPVDYCAVLLYDRKVGQLRVAALSHQGENDVTLPGTLLEAGSDTIAQHIWETQEAIWINALQDTWTWKHPFITNLQTILAAPLTTNGVRIGVLELGSEQANRYSQMDMVTFEQVSTQLSVGLSNAEAYSQSQQLARNKMLANDIVAQLQRQMEVEDILRITATELGQALGATRARVRLGFDTRKEGDTDG